MKNRNQQSFLQVSLSSIIAQKQKNRILALNASATPNIPNILLGSSPELCEVLHRIHVF